MFQHLGLSEPLGATQEPFTRFGTRTRLELTSTRGKELFKLNVSDSKEFQALFLLACHFLNQYQEQMSVIAI